MLHPGVNRLMLHSVLCLRTYINFCRYFPRLFGVSEVPCRKESCTAVKVCECRENGAGEAGIFLTAANKITFTRVP